MHDLQVIDSNFTILECHDPRSHKSTCASPFHLIFHIKTYLDNILNISADICIPYYKIDILNFKFCHICTKELQLNNYLLQCFQKDFY